MDSHKEQWKACRGRMLHGQGSDLTASPPFVQGDKDPKWKNTPSKFLNFTIWLTQY